MQIGTWNLAGRWTSSHLDFLKRLDCDVLLLTEVSDRTEIPGYHGHLSGTAMARDRRWAGVFSRSFLDPRDDPHPASAMAVTMGRTFCSSVLPWRSCGDRLPWIGGRHEDRTKHAVASLTDRLPSTDLVWGGDWNHALEGKEYAGSLGGRRHLLAAVEHLGLKVPTSALPHRIEGLASIDHVGVGAHQAVRSAERVQADDGPLRLSDHDAYVVSL